MERTEKNEISTDLCEDMENKYNQMLLTPDEQSQLFNKIMGYYQLKEQFIKQAIKKCQVCGSKSEHGNKPCDIFTSSYNTHTFCRELKITCCAKNKCRGMVIKYGIVFNLDTQTNENKKLLEFIKEQIIINKNNILYGLIDEEPGINIHNTLLKQLEDITNMYKKQLYYMLFYSNNQHMNKDIQQLRNDIHYKITEIKQHVIKENYVRAIEEYIDIIKLHNCVVNMNKYKSSIYSEQLFKCNSTDINIGGGDHPDIDTILNITTMAPPPTPEPIEISQKKKNAKTTVKQSDTTTSRHLKKIEKINHILDHMSIIFEDDFIDQLLKDDKNFIEQVYTEMNDLKKIIKYATDEQKDKYDKINTLYENKINELQWTPDQMTDDSDDGPPALLKIEEIPTTDDPALQNKFDSEAIQL